MKYILILLVDPIPKRDDWVMECGRQQFDSEAAAHAYATKLQAAHKELIAYRIEEIPN